MSLTKASYSMITGASANVLDYGADPTGVADSTAAFTAAIATGKRVYIPKGTYSAADISFPSGTEIEGESRGTILNVRTSGSGFFTIAGAYNYRIMNCTAGVDTGIINARFIKQTDLSQYSAYCYFENIETRAEFLYSYEGFFIFTSWHNCRDGYVGSPGATHVFIKSVPASSSQGTQTNICQVVECQIFGAAGTLGAVKIEWGYRWDFLNTDFEANATNAVQALGIRGLSFTGCWFEANNTAYTIYCQNSTAPNTQGTTVTIDNCVYAGRTGNIYFLWLGGAAAGAITNLSALTVPTGCYLVNATTLQEMFAVAVYSGVTTAAFLNGCVAYRDKITFAATGVNSITTGVVNGTTPESTGITVNAGNGGRTYMLTWSFQTGAGNATASSLYMIRIGYDAGFYTATKISGDAGATVGGDVATFSLDVPTLTLYIAGAGAGNGRFGILGN